MIKSDHQGRAFLADAEEWLDAAACEVLITRLLAAGDGRLALFLLEIPGMSENRDLSMIGDAPHRHTPSLLFAAPIPGNARIALLGREQVGIVLPGCGRAEAVALGEQIAGGGVTIQHGGMAATTIAIRAGLAVSPGHGRSYRVLVSRAELALLGMQFKKPGGLAVFEPWLEREAIARAQLRQELHEALRQDAFELHFQPQCDIATGRLIGFEALLRWRHPQRGLLGPAQFLDVLEQTTLARETDRWVLETAARRAADWARLGRPFRVAVNISPGGLRPALVDEVASTLAQVGLSPHFLEIEIPERHALDDLSMAADTVQRLRHLGVSVALDDFGTGFASLTALSALEVDRLKIDRAFVREITVAPKCAAIVSGLTLLQSKLGLRVMAEGIETEGQRAMLASMGCHEGQGYLFGRPLPGNAADTLVLAGTQRAVRGIRRAS